MRVTFKEDLTLERLESCLIASMPGYFFFRRYFGSSPFAYNGKSLITWDNLLSRIQGGTFQPNIAVYIGYLAPETTSPDNTLSCSVRSYAGQILATLVSTGFSIDYFSSIFLGDSNVASLIGSFGTSYCRLLVL